MSANFYDVYIDCGALPSLIIITEPAQTYNVTEVLQHILNGSFVELAWLLPNDFGDFSPRTRIDYHDHRPGKQVAVSPNRVLMVSEHLYVD